MKNQIKNAILALGADLCGVAGTERFKDAPPGFHPGDLYSDCKSVIVFAKRLPSGLTTVNPRIIYTSINDQAKNELDRISYLGALAIEEMGGIAVPLPSDGPYDFWDAERLEGRGILSMRHAALLAGIGSMGKNTLIINARYGNMINIGAILTNLDLPSDPLAEDLCINNCRLCLDNCPQHALDGHTVNQKLCRTHTYVTNARSFSICQCNRCRVVCPRANGVK